MEWIDLIKRYIDLSIDYFRSIISNPWTPEFLLFISTSGLLLYAIYDKLWTPCKKCARIIGITFTTFGLGSIMIAILFGMNIHFTFPEVSARPRSTTATNEYLITGENQHKTVGKILHQKDFSQSKWDDIRKWQGTGPMQTEPFQISTYLWMVDWNTMSAGESPALFSIKVNSAEGKFIGFVANTKGEDRGSVLMKISGDYYLVIETKQKYTVSVRVKKE